MFLNKSSLSCSFGHNSDLWKVSSLDCRNSILLCIIIAGAKLKQTGLRVKS